MIGYAGHTRRLRVAVSADGSVTHSDGVRLGACIEWIRPDGVREHRETTDSDDLALVRATVLRDVDDIEPLRELARELRAELGVALFHQHVVAGPSDAQRADDRFVASLTVTVHTATGPRSDVLGWRSPDPSAVQPVVEELHRRAELPAAEVPHDADVVLLPGRAGAFFHELIGHPMEADVLGSGTSWLSGRAGQRIAPEWLSVLDGVHDPAGGYRATIDDEGTPTRAVELVDRGRVGVPMTDRTMAARLGLAPTGHGRRLDHTHPAVPRMAHTRAEFPPDTPLDPPTRPALAPHGLQLERMSLATGEFVFRAASATLHRDRAYRVGPFELHGRADTVLATLRPVDARVCAHGRADRGCGKLGQFPLPVSFANAGVRLPHGAVTVR